TVSMRRIFNTPKRGLGDRSEATVEAFASRERISFGAAMRRPPGVPGLAPRAINVIDELVAMLEEARDRSVVAPPDEVLELLLTRSGLLARLEESLDPQDEGRVENLQELVSVAREYAERAEAAGEVATLAGFLEQVALVADADEVPSEQGVVTLMTLHTAKG